MCRVWHLDVCFTWVYSSSSPFVPHMCSPKEIHCNSTVSITLYKNRCTICCLDFTHSTSDNNKHLGSIGLSKCNTQLVFHTLGKHCINMWDNNWSFTTTTSCEILSTHSNGSMCVRVFLCASKEQNTQNTSAGVGYSFCIHLYDTIKKYSWYNNTFSKEAHSLQLKQTSQK